MRAARVVQRRRRRQAAALLVGLALLSVVGSASTGGSYTVERGDTLSAIAKRFGVGTRALAAANRITDLDRIIAGRTLVIPAGGPGAPAAVPASYVVQPGDTLASIATRHGISVSALVAANSLADPNRIIAGRSIAVPTGAGSAAAAPAPAAPAATHTVASGDTLGAIARRFGVGAGDLASANGVTDVRRLRVGQVLTVPGAKTTPGAAPPAAAVQGSGLDPSRLPSRLAASPARLALIPSFTRWSATYGVPADLVMAVAWYESGWRNDVVSSAGALGIGQLLPSTVVWLETSVMGVDLDAAVPDDNIRMSARYLAWLLERTGGDARMAAAAYYQGLRSVRAVGLYGETRTYVDGVQAVRDRWF